MTFKTLCIQRILRWRLFIDEFDVTLTYVPGKENILGNAFSRLPWIDRPTEGKGNGTIVRKLKRNGKIIDFKNIKLPKNDKAIIEDKLYQDELYYEVFVSDASSEANGVLVNEDNDVFATIDEDNEFMECMLNLPSIQFDREPVL